MIEALVDELARCGMTAACISPGSRSAPLAYALWKDPRIAVHVVIDERSASFRALGMAKASGRPVAVVSTSGTAAANFLPAVVEAHHSNASLLVMTADRPPELRDTGAGQTIDQVKLYGDAVRWFSEVADVDDAAYWRSIGCRAYASAMAGPVHLNIGFREPLLPGPATSEGRLDGKPWIEVHLGVAVTEVDRLAEIVGSAKRGVVLAGSGQFDPTAIVMLAEALGWPLFAEAISGARFGPNCISTYDALLRSERFDPPDVAIRLGSMGTSKVLEQWLGASYQIAIGSGWADPKRMINLRIDADIAHTCRSLASVVEAPNTEWLDVWKRVEVIARQVIDSLDVNTEPGVARDLAASIPDGSTLVVASSMPIRDLDWVMSPRQGIRFIANRGANGIDGFVSTAVGAASVNDATTFALCGDLALLHDQNGLIGLADLGLDLLFVVINNNGGGIFSFLPHAELRDSFEALFGTPHGLDLRLIAETNGLGHSTSFPEALHQRGPLIIEVRTDRTENVEVHRAIWEAVSQALRSSSET